MENLIFLTDCDSNFDNGKLKLIFSCRSFLFNGLSIAIADALEKVGRDGIISLEEGKSTFTELEVTEGMRFEKGFVSPYFVNRPEKMEVVLENP